MFSMTIKSFRALCTLAACKNSISNGNIKTGLSAKTGVETLYSLSVGTGTEVLLVEESVSLDVELELLDAKPNERVRNA